MVQVKVTRAWHGFSRLHTAEVDLKSIELRMPMGVASGQMRLEVPREIRPWVQGVLQIVAERRMGCLRIESKCIDGRFSLLRWESWCATGWEGFFSTTLRKEEPEPEAAEIWVPHD